MQPRHYLPGTLMVVLLSLQLSESTTYIDRQAQALRSDSQHFLSSFSDVPQYAIEAQLDADAGKLDGSLELIYTNRTSAEVADLAFRLLPNARHIYGGGELEVRGVTQNGQSVQPQLEAARTAMRVTLLSPLAPGQSTSVQIEFTARVPSWTTQGYGIFNPRLWCCAAGRLVSGAGDL